MSNVDFVIIFSANPIIQALDRVQLENQTLRRTVKDQELKIASLKADLIALNGDGQTRKKVATTLTYGDRLRGFAKKFSLLEEVWVQPEWYGIASENFAELLAKYTENPLARFESDQSYSEAACVALHQYVPNQYHEDLCTNPEFARLVCIDMFAYVLH